MTIEKSKQYRDQCLKAEALRHSIERDIIAVALCMAEDSVRYGSDAKAAEVWMKRLREVVDPLESLNKMWKEYDHLVCEQNNE